jgi:hypothetical protein
VIQEPRLKRLRCLHPLYLAFLQIEGLRCFRFRTQRGLTTFPHAFLKAFSTNGLVHSKGQCFFLLDGTKIDQNVIGFAAKSFWKFHLLLLNLYEALANLAFTRGRLLVDHLNFTTYRGATEPYTQSSPTGASKLITLLLALNFYFAH